MKRNRNVLLTFFIIFLMSFIWMTTVDGQVKKDKPYQTPTTAEYIGTAVDTVLIAGITTALRRGLVTNISASASNPDLIVWFSDASGVLDSNRKVIVPVGKSLKFVTSGGKIYRQASADSCFSQVIIGDVEIMHNGKEETFFYASSTPQLHQWNTTQTVDNIYRNLKTEQEGIVLKLPHDMLKEETIKTKFI